MIHPVLLIILYEILWVCVCECACVCACVCVMNQKWALEEKCLLRHKKNLTCFRVINTGL